MKNLASFLFIVLFSFLGLHANAQGYSRDYKANCDCFEVKNHLDNGQLSAHFFETNDGKRNGVEKVFYPNGNLQYERTWVNNKLNGVGKHYFIDGSLYYEEYHELGIRKGIWKYFDNEGDLVSEVSYTGNEQDGTYTYYHAGVKFYSYKVENNAKVSETIHNKEIFDVLREEAEANQNATKE